MASIKHPGIHATPEVLVLLSGGVDSAACADFFLRLGRPLIALHVSYGQPAEVHEKESAISIADHYQIPLLSTTWLSQSTKTSGLVFARNAFLITSAMMECPSSVNVIACGIHAGTPYSDCSSLFAKSIQDLFLIHHERQLALATPFIEMPKTEIFKYCNTNNVPVHLTYSCEQGCKPPCGHCASCKDREALYACS